MAVPVHIVPSQDSCKVLKIFFEFPQSPATRALPVSNMCREFDWYGMRIGVLPVSNMRRELDSYL